MKRYVFASIGLLFSAFLISPQTMAYVFPFALVSGLLVDRGAFRLFTRLKFLIFLLILILGLPLLLGERQAWFIGIPYSPDIFLMSLSMAARSIIILASVKILTRHISVEEMSGALQRIRLKNFSQVFALSMNQLPQVRRLAAETFSEFKQRPADQTIFSHALTAFARLIARILYHAEKEFSGS